MKLQTKSGRLTRYALSCGYVERSERDYGTIDYHSVTLRMDCSVIQVLTYSRGRASQFTARNIKEARRVFSEQLRAHGLEFRNS